MGAAADEIDLQIRETRDHIDANLAVLESRAASNARRYGRIALVAIGTLALAGAGFFVYRRITGPSRTARLQGRLRELPDSLRSLPDSLRDLYDRATSRMKKPLPSIRLTVSEQTDATWLGRLEGPLRRIAPAVVGAATTAIIRHANRSSKSSDARHARAD
jgi:hypothetical protein